MRRSLVTGLAAALCALASTTCGGAADRPAGQADATSSSACAPDVTSTSTTSLAPTTLVSPEATTAGPVTTTTPSPTPTTTPARPTAPPAVAPPATDPRVARVSAADLGASWHAGCPVGPADLRRVTVTYVGFDGAEHDGALIVHADAARATLAAFDRLRHDRFPIRKIVPVDRYGASDDASMADDNTSAFNCRPSTGSPSTWSQHAYGRGLT